MRVLCGQKPHTWECFDHERCQEGSEAIKLIHSLEKERDEAKGKLDRINLLYCAWADADEPEGAPSGRRTVRAIGEVLGY